jgi:hypothetical protein
MGNAANCLKPSRCRCVLLVPSRCQALLAAVQGASCRRMETWMQGTLRTVQGAGYCNLTASTRAPGLVCAPLYRCQGAGRTRQT